MNGTVAPPSSRSTAAVTCRSRTPSSSAIRRWTTDEPVDNRAGMSPPMGSVPGVVETVRRTGRQRDGCPAGRRVSPVYVGRPYVGSRPYRDISFCDDANTLQREEFGHDLTVWIGTNPGDRVVYQALAADSAAVTEMRTIFSNTGNCTQITANGGVGDHGQDPSGRYRAFVSLSGSYKCTSYGHMLIYPFVQYGTDGTKTRAESDSDVAAEVTMLQRKYRWIQQWYLLRPRVHRRRRAHPRLTCLAATGVAAVVALRADREDRKSTRLNSSHVRISY